MAREHAELAKNAEEHLTQSVDRPWLSSYPPGVPAEIDPGAYRSLTHLLEEAFRNHGRSCAAVCMDSELSFAQLDELSSALGAWLQSRQLAKGARVALMMPNVPQYPVAVAGILRAGLVVVNVNPLYTPRELEHQLKDAGAKAIVIIENFASTLQSCIANTAVKHVVLCAMGDQLGWLKGALVNYVVRNVKRMVPAMASQIRAFVSRRDRAARISAPTTPMAPASVGVAMAPF